MKKAINVARSSMPSMEEYIDELKPVWDSRWLTNRGTASIRFEEQLKDYLGCENVWLFANGHLALELTLQCLDLHGEVITTPYTHISTTHSIVRNGLTPVFVDIREDNCNINPEQIEAAITENTVAIVATHAYGFLCDVDEIERIAEKNDLRVIYDAAHAFGVTRRGVSAACFGDAAVFSTHATKVFHTVEGGFTAYKKPALFDALRYLVNFGFTGQEEADYIGTNARMNEFEAAMGICNLKYIDESIKERKTAGDRYLERLSGVRGIRFIRPEKDIEWNYAFMPAFFDEFRKTRDEVQVELANDSVYTRKYFYPIITKYHCYQEQYGMLHLPVAERAADTVLALPIYAGMTIEDVDRVCDVILR